MQKHIKKSFSFFWVNPWRLNFTYLRCGTPCLFHLHRWCTQEEFFPLTPPMKIKQCVPKRRHAKFRSQGITKRKNTTSPLFVHAKVASKYKIWIWVKVLIVGQIIFLLPGIWYSFRDFCPQKTGLLREKPSSLLPPLPVSLHWFCYP